MSPKSTLARRFVMTAIFAIVVGAVVARTARPATAGHAPPACSRLVEAVSGIMRLQFARTPACAEALKAEWDSRLTRARVSLALDFLFIVLYVSALRLFCRWIAGHGTSPHWRRVLRAAAAAAVVAGALDAVENVALFAVLAGHTGTWPVVAFVCASVKFALIAAVLAVACVGWVGVESRLTPFLSKPAATPDAVEPAPVPFRRSVVVFLAYLWPSRVPILTGAVLLFLGLGTSGSRYLSGLLDPVAETALLPIAIVGLLCAWSATMVLCLVWAHGGDRLFLPAARQPLTSAPGRVWFYGTIVGTPVLIATISRSSAWSGRSVPAMVLYAASGVIIAALMLGLTLRASRSVFGLPMTASIAALFRSLLRLANRFTFLRPGFLEGTADAPRLRPGHGLAAFLASASVATFVLVGFATRNVANPQWASALLYVLLLVLSLTWMVGVFAFVLDRTRVPILIYALLWFLIVDVACRKQTDLEYETYVLEGNSAAGSASEALTAGNPATPILVAASGGGIQAAGWTAQVLTGLADAIPEFPAHVQLLSGVSGGSVGIMHFLTQDPQCGPDLRSGDRTGRRDALKHAMDSSLHAVGWGLVYQDFPRTFIPLFTRSRVNRGLLMEDAWKRDPRLGAEVDPNTAEGRTALLSSWRRNVAEGPCPGAIFNAMVAETGEPMLFSTIPLPRTLDRFSFERHYPDLDVKLTTAVRLSATFPYVSPAVRAEHDSDPRYARAIESGRKVARFNHVVDGGYFDNFGVASAAGWLDAALSGLARQSRPARILVVEICESHTCSSDDLGQTPAFGGAQRSWVYQLYAPVSALLAMRTSAQRVRNRSHLILLQQRWLRDVCIATVRFPYPSAEGPMSWHLTEHQKNEIRDAWTNDARSRASVEMVRRFITVPPAVDPQSGELLCELPTR
jgi:hypothetical protein